MGKRVSNSLYLSGIMASILIVASFSLCVFFIGSAQAIVPVVYWEKTAGTQNDDSGRSIYPTSDGGYIFTGGESFSGEGKWYAYIGKTDSDGKLQWEHILDGYDSEGIIVRPTPDGGYIIGGRDFTGDNWLGNLLLIKMDSTGNILWNRSFGGNGYEDMGSLDLTSDGGYIIAGSTGSYGGDGKIYLVKADANGNEQWHKTYGGAGLNSGYFIDQDADGGYTLVGTAEPVEKMTSVHIFKVDKDGNVQRESAYDLKGISKGIFANRTTDGGCIIGGMASGTVFLLKVGAQKEIQWVKVYNETYNALLDGRVSFVDTHAVRQTLDGGYVIVGERLPSETYRFPDVLLMGTDDRGNPQWEVITGGGTTDYGYDVQPVKDGGYIIVGKTFSYGRNVGDIHNGDIYLIKVWGPSDKIGVTAVPSVDNKNTAPNSASTPGFESWMAILSLLGLAYMVKAK